MRWPGDTHNRRDGVTVPTIGVAFMLSLLIHALVLWQWSPETLSPEQAAAKSAGVTQSLSVRLSAPPDPPPPPPLAATKTQPSPAPVARAPKVATRAPPPPTAPAPPIAISKPVPIVPVPAQEPPPPAVSAPAPASPSAGGDLASFIEAQRRARAASENTSAKAAPVEDDKSRANRVAAANLSTQRIMTFGYDPNRSGGVFKMQRTGLNDAEFMYYGWNPDARRNTAQLIEVRRGNHDNIRIAVVRKMIAIIRDNVQEEDFLWDSRRLGRSVVLSARAKDNAGLEEFMLLEVEF